MQAASKGCQLVLDTTSLVNRKTAFWVKVSIACKIIQTYRGLVRSITILLVLCLEIKLKDYIFSFWFQLLSFHYYLRYHTLRIREERSSVRVWLRIAVLSTCHMHVTTLLYSLNSINITFLIKIKNFGIKSS